MAGELLIRVDGASDDGVLRIASGGDAGKLVTDSGAVCGCCGGAVVQWVQLFPCCVGPTGTPGDAFPDTAGPWYAKVSDVEACMGVSPLTSGTIKYPSGGGGFCMRFDVSVAGGAPIPAGELPEEYSDMSPGEGTECRGDIVNCDQNPSIPSGSRFCPMCPECCITQGYTNNCMPNATGCGTTIRCGYGRAYALTFDYESEIITQNPRGICANGTITNCEPDPLTGERRRIRQSGTLTYTRNCPATSISCSGTFNFQDLREVYTRTLNTATCVWSARSTATPININETRACTAFQGLVSLRTTMLTRPLPGTDTRCEANVVIDNACNGLPWIRQEYDWDRNNACFGATMHYDFVNRELMVDGGLCAIPNCSMGNTPGNCIGSVCRQSEQHYRLTYSIVITSTDQCGGPWEAIRLNTAGGCTSTNAGGLWDGWYALLGVGAGGGLGLLLSEGFGDPLELA